MSGAGMRTLAAIAEGDWNILLTNPLTPESRMMIRRRVPERLSELAEFITWDPDPYMVITDAGRLVWIVDGYTDQRCASVFARRDRSRTGSASTTFAIRSKRRWTPTTATSICTSSTKQDPLVGAYRRLFPNLFPPASAMPADLRAHARAPEMLFRTQAEIYRTYHMRDPESFYNRADLWDLATFTTGQGGQPQTVPPTYMIATLPGESRAGVPADGPVHAAQQAESDRPDGGALRRRASGRDWCSWICPSRKSFRGRCRSRR